MAAAGGTIAYCHYTKDRECLYMTDSLVFWDAPAVVYRVYFTRRGEVLYLLLLGGDKSSQKRDIQLAIKMARALDKE